MNRQEAEDLKASDESEDEIRAIARRGPTGYTSPPVKSGFNWSAYRLEAEIEEIHEAPIEPGPAMAT